MLATLAFACAITMSPPQSEAQGTLKLPKGMYDGAKLKADFNANRDRVRLMFIFSPS